VRRLLQFVVLGGAIFLIAPRRTRTEIDLSRAALGRLEAAEAKKTGRADLAAIAERAIEDEVLVREALRLGLGDNDPIVRQRLVQKVLYLAEELEGAADPPTDAELSRFFEKTRGEWRRPERLRFRHTFAHEPTVLVAEPSPLPAEIDLTRAQVEAALGGEFVAVLEAAAKAGERAPKEPIRSALGWHRVERLELTPEAPAELAEVRGAVRTVMAVRRRQEAVARYLERAFERYEVRLDGERVAAIHPAGRTAIRGASSAED
jgi:hypothetical protein